MKFLFKIGLILLLFASCHKRQCVTCYVKGHPQVKRVVFCGCEDEVFAQMKALQKIYPDYKILCPLQ